jgi:hypothetical protein
MAGDGFFTAKNAAAVTTHDTNPLARGKTGMLFVGGAGNITCRFAGESSDTLLTGVLAGALLPFQVTHIRATGTTATNMVALY